MAETVEMFVPKFNRVVTVDAADVPTWQAAGAVYAHELVDGKPGDVKAPVDGSTDETATAATADDPTVKDKEHKSAGKPATRASR